MKLSKLKVTVENDVVKVQGWARDIVGQRLLIIGGVTAVLNYLVSVHAPYVTPAMSNSAADWTNRGLDILAVFAAWRAIKARVTPADQNKQPVNLAGQLLVPAATTSAVDTAAKLSGLVPAANTDQVLTVGKSPAPVVSDVPVADVKAAAIEQLKAADAQIDAVTPPAAEPEPVAAGPAPEVSAAPAAAAAPAAPAA